MPTPGKHNVTPEARRLFLEILAEREKKGIETYGTTLQTHNGRDAFQDSLEELVDCFQYLVQHKMELTGM